MSYIVKHVKAFRSAHPPSSQPLFFIQPIPFSDVSLQSEHYCSHWLLIWSKSEAVGTIFQMIIVVSPPFNCYIKVMWWWKLYSDEGYLVIKVKIVKEVKEAIACDVSHVAMFGIPVKDSDRANRLLFPYASLCVSCCPKCHCCCQFLE